MQSLQNAVLCFHLRRIKVIPLDIIKLTKIIGYLNFEKFILLIL